MATLGGVHDSEASQNSVEIDSLARFAVEEHNKKENALLEFARVVKAEEQVVSGTMYHLTIEAIEAGKKNIYEAKVWVKPWLNFMELKEFKHAGDVPVFTSSDLGVLKGTVTNYNYPSFNLSDDKMATLGGVHDSEASQNSVEIESLARFAVEEHNKKENALLEFARVVKAKEQVVSGTMHHLTIEAIEAGKKNIYEAKVWVKPWLNFMELKEFKHAGDVPVFTSSDLGVLKDGHGPGWQSVPVHDPSVQDAANHALKSIQQSSNSLFPYNLQEIVHANAEVEDDSAKFDLLLKVKRGSAEEKLKVVVHKNSEGTYHLNRMEPHL
uniref:Cysteine proteinase inhibitor n=1 Tax=Salix viminalis TaxID=40686 RepID=A0A6N2M8U8_SALVM